jgi:hypothetical protein
MISSTRNKVNWESGEEKRGITPLILGNSGFYFILFYFWGWLCCCVLKNKRGWSQWLSRHGSNSDEIGDHVRGSKFVGGKMRWGELALNVYEEPLLKLYPRMMHRPHTPLPKTSPKNSTFKLKPCQTFKCPNQLLMELTHLN